mgnify:CR=1 FL=1
MSCVVCGKFSERDHIRTRGASGSDEAFNIMNLCRTHHVERHAIGYKSMSEKYKTIKNALEKKGWYFNEHNKLKRR